MLRILALCLFLAAPVQAADAEKFKSLVAADWKYRMETFPEFATYVGYPGQNDRWTDMSSAAIAKRQEYDRTLLAELERIDKDKLTKEDQLNYDLLRWDVERDVKSAKFPDELLILNQLEGIHISPLQVLQSSPKHTTADLENILSRLKALPRLISQHESLLREGIRRKVMPPKVALRKVAEDLRKMHETAPDKHPLLLAFAEKPASVSNDRFTVLSKEAAAVVTKQVLPAYEAFTKFFVDEYYPQTTKSVGLSQLPDGEAWYRYKAERSTTTTLTPVEIHELGKSEVKRIRGLMEAIIKESKFKGDFQDFLKFLKTDPKFYYQSEETLLAGYRDIAKRADYELIRFFGHLPRLPYGVEPVPDYMKESSPTAFYRGGSIAAGRPGMFMANTYNLPSRPKWEMEALTLHEAVPGHHLQISIANELEHVPEFRKHGGHTAYIEGWGLYAESLGYEMGFYQDAYSKFGALTYEMWRAIRLVVDTGMHALGWSRQQAIDYFLANTGKPLHDVTVEVDRYIVWPGQALAYKIGELKFKELRGAAQKQLGKQFDIRRFHDELLGAGSLPLDILEERMQRWVSEQQNENAARSSSQKRAG